MELQTIPLRFRVWDKEEKRFTHFADCPIEMNLWELQEFLGMHDEADYEAFIISQDTGLKDKNGKSIYTGDIVEWENDIWEVGFDYCRGELYLYCHKTGEHESCNDKKEPWWEIIGNIWQHGELLERA